MNKRPKGIFPYTAAEMARLAADRHVQLDPDRIVHQFYSLATMDPKDLKDAHGVHQIQVEGVTQGYTLNLEPMPEGEVPHKIVLIEGPDGKAVDIAVYQYSHHPSAESLHEAAHADIAQTLRDLDESIERRIEMPPGKRMLEWAGILFSSRSVELVIEPLVADYRHEMYAALSSGAGAPKIHAIHARYRIGFLIAALELIAPVVGRLVKAFRGS